VDREREKRISGSLARFCGNIYRMIISGSEMTMVAKLLLISPVKNGLIERRFHIFHPRTMTHVLSMCCHIVQLEELELPRSGLPHLLSDFSPYPLPLIKPSSASSAIRRQVRKTLPSTVGVWWVNVEHQFFSDPGLIIWGFNFLTLGHHELWEKVTDIAAETRPTFFFSFF
jgi:hypothetical protein